MLKTSQFWWLSCRNSIGFIVLLNGENDFDFGTIMLINVMTKMIMIIINGDFGDNNTNIDNLEDGIIGNSRSHHK